MNAAFPLKFIDFLAWQVLSQRKALKNTRFRPISPSKYGSCALELIAFHANRTGSQLLELSPNVFKWGLFSEMLKLAMFEAIFRTLRTEQN